MDNWQEFRAPQPDEDEPAFCHQCGVIFDLDEPVMINLYLGKMLCQDCYMSFFVG